MAATAGEAGEGPFAGKWMDGDGAVVVVQAQQLLWPDGSTCEIDVKDGNTLQLKGGEDVCEGKLSSDGGWLVWSDGDTWVRMLGATEAEAGGDDDCSDDDGSEDNDDEPQRGGATDAGAGAEKIQTNTPRTTTPTKATKEDVSTSDSEDSEASPDSPADKDSKEKPAPEDIPVPTSDQEASQPQPEDADEEAQRRKRQQEEAEEELRYREEEEQLNQKWQEWDEEEQEEPAPSPSPEGVQPNGDTAEPAPSPSPEGAQPNGDTAEPAPSPSPEGVQPNSDAAAKASEEASSAPGTPRPKTRAFDFDVIGEMEEAEAAAAPESSKDVQEPPPQAAAPEPQEPEEPPPKAPKVKVIPIDDPLTGEFPLERSIDRPELDALETPKPNLMTSIYAEPLKYKVSYKHVMLRKEPSTQSERAALLQAGDQITGYQQGHWLFLTGKAKGWLLLDGSKLGLGNLVNHQYLGLRVQQTFEEAVLVEWDRLTAAKFVDYAVQWSYPSDPETITTAASHMPRASAKITGLPSNVKIQLRLCASVYTETKSNGGERFAVLVGPWCEAETVEEPGVDALVDPRPEKMPDVYSAPLDYKVHFKQVVVRYSPSTKAKAYGTIPKGKDLSGYQQGNWLMLTKPVRGWALIDGEKQGCGLLLEHKYLEPTIIRGFAEAALVEWTPLPGARFVDYFLQYRHTNSEPWITSTEHIARPQGLVHGLSPDEKAFVRVCANIYTQTKGNNGQYFGTVVGPDVEAETEPPVSAIEEESLCLDPMANLRGRCMDCDCKGLVGTQFDMDVKPSNTMENSVVCRRCGCSCVRHMIIGEFQYRKMGAKPTPSAFRLPQRLLQQAEREAKEAEDAQKALTNGSGQTANQSAPKLVGPLVWRPEDSGLDDDRVGFTLDKIAQARNLYETLGVPPDCEDKDIRSAHRRIALHIHPDKVQNRNDADMVKQAEAAFKIVSAAYEILGDPLKRGAYNQSIRNWSSSGGGSRTTSTRKDLTAATLLRRFLSKQMWGWDLEAKPPGDWEEYGKGVYGKSKHVKLTVMHAITKEEVKFEFERGTTVQTLKAMIISKVKRGPARSIELATAEGDEIEEDFRFSSSMNIVLAGISSLGPAKDVKVCLSHAHTGARHYIEVPDTSTIAEVRDAASKSLKANYRVLRLGCRYNNRDKLQDFEDSELLNGRTQILILGVDIPIHLSVDEATELQSELLQAYGEASFQRELDALLAQHPPLDGIIEPDFRERWDYLLKHAQKNILLKHGFDGPHGAITMLASFHDVNYHEEVQRLGAEIDAKLRITQGTALPPVIPVLVQPADEDCDSDDEVQRGIKVVLIKGGTILQLKEGIAKKLKEDITKIEVVTMAKPELFSKKPRGILVHADDEAIGAKRLFQVRGIKMPDQAELNKALQEQQRQRQAVAAEQAKIRRKEEEAAGWDKPMECLGCHKKIKACRGHVSKDDSKWYCNQCWASHNKMDGRHNAAHAILAADSVAATEGAIDFETRRCTTPGCKYRMHRNARLGAYIYCCLPCKEGMGHGFSCERRDPLREETPEPTPEEREKERQRQREEDKKMEAINAEKRALAMRAAEPAKPAPAPAAPAKPAAESKPSPPAAKPRQEDWKLAAVSKEEKKAEEVTVEVKSVNHADQIVKMDIAATATWIEVKRALAWRIGRPAVLSDGKLAVKGADGYYASFEDSKAVKESHEVVLMNCDLSYNPDAWDIGAEEYKKAERKRSQQQAGAPPEKKPPPKETQETSLTVKDLRVGTGFDMKVLKTMTGGEIREAIAFATNRNVEDLAEGKLLKRGGEGYVSVTDEEVAGDKRALWMMGVEIAPKKGSPAEKMLKKGQPVVSPQVEKERAKQAEKEGDEEGWRLAIDDAKDPELVMVTISNAATNWDTPVELVVMDNAPLSTVLEALADRLGRAEVMRLGKFVERKGAAAFKALRMEEPVKKRRDLLLLGLGHGALSGGVKKGK